MRKVVRGAVDLVVGDTWPKRRKVIYAVLMFCALLIAACLGAAIAAKDMVAATAVSTNAFFLGGSVAGSYLFGSIWDDRDKRKHLPTSPEQGE